VLRPSKLALRLLRRQLLAADTMVQQRCTRVQLLQQLPAVGTMVQQHYMLVQLQRPMEQKEPGMMGRPHCMQAQLR